MGYLILSIESSYFLGISNLQFLFWPSETNSSCISYYLRGAYTYLLSYLPPLLLLSILLILSLFLITLTFLPLPSIPYMFNLICTNTLYIFNSITLIHHSSIFFYSSPPTKPSPILYLDITSRRHQFFIAISFCFHI